MANVATIRPLKKNENPAMAVIKTTNVFAMTVKNLKMVSAPTKPPLNYVAVPAETPAITINALAPVTRYRKMMFALIKRKNNYVKKATGHGNYSNVFVMTESMI